MEPLFVGDVDTDENYWDCFFAHVGCVFDCGDCNIAGLFSLELVDAAFLFFERMYAISSIWFIVVE